MYSSRRHIIFIEEPHTESYAALVLLNAKLSLQERSEWENLRLTILKSSNMVCEYCGKGNLTETLDVLKGRSFLATIDHVMPISKGGAIYDRANLKIACYPCNKNKGNLFYDDWIKRKL